MYLGKAADPIGSKNGGGISLVAMRTAVARPISSSNDYIQIRDTIVPGHACNRFGLSFSGFGDERGNFFSHIFEEHAHFSLFGKVAADSQIGESFRDLRMRHGLAQGLGDPFDAIRGRSFGSDPYFSVAHDDVGS